MVDAEQHGCSHQNNHADSPANKHSAPPMAICCTSRPPPAGHADNSNLQARHKLCTCYLKNTWKVMLAVAWLSGLTSTPSLASIA